MSRLDEVGTADGWRCWLCDEAIDPQMSVNDARGPSIDARATASKAKAKAKVGGSVQERLAHRGCNTRKGAIVAVVPWPDHLFVADPAPIIGSVERLQRKGGKEIMARCVTLADAREVAEWLVDRVGRLAPELAARAEVDAGGGQFLVVLRA